MMTAKGMAAAACGVGMVAGLLWAALDSTGPRLAVAPAADNFIYLRDLGQGGGTPRPVTISRVFRQGEVPQFAQAVVGGQKAPTQCDVKSRWPDGSLRHAILSFWVAMNSNQAVKVQFIGQSSGNDAEQTPAAELAKTLLAGRWDAAIEAKANTAGGEGAVHKVALRQLLANWDGTDSENGIRHWLKGPICTQLIVEDKTPSLREDFGWRTALAPAALTASINATDQTITTRAADAEAVSKWSFPLTAYVNAEQIRLCSANGAALTVCKDGRGANGTEAKPHAAGRVLAPDQGWTDASEDKYRSLHPVFVVTFYPNWSGVKVDYILENTWATRMQDQVYQARLLGGTGDEELWSGQIVQPAATRWRKTFWLGARPPSVQVDHNLRYMAATGAIPNYDPDVKVSAAAVAKEVQAFRRSNPDNPMGTGNWQVVMPATGGRGDLGVLPRWYVMYLYTFRPEMEELMLGNGNASGTAPVHFRESLADGRLFDADKTTPAFGRVVSIDARPTVRLMPGLMTLSDTKLEDRVSAVGTMTPGDWQVDIEHQPSMAYVPYLVTGDWYYLEEMYFWSSFDVASGNPGYCNFCRLGSAGYIHDSASVRAEAWGLRTLAQTAFAAGDGSAERAYFTEKLNNNIAIKEGKYELASGNYYEPAPDCKAPCKDTLWRFGRDYIGQGLSNPLHFAGLGAPGQLDATIDSSKVYAVAAPWEANFLHIVLGYMEDLGFQQVHPMRVQIGLNLVNQLQNPKYNPYLAGEYRIPERRLPDQAFYDNWEDVRRGYAPAMQDIDAFPPLRLGAADTYPYILKAAASYMTGINDSGGISGQAGYDWISGKLPRGLYNQDPTWALVPREPPLIGAAVRKAKHLN